MHGLLQLLPDPRDTEEPRGPGIAQIGEKGIDAVCEPDRSTDRQRVELDDDTLAHVRKWQIRQPARTFVGAGLAGNVVPGDPECVE